MDGWSSVIPIFQIPYEFDCSTNSNERDRVGGAPKWAKEEIWKRERELPRKLSRECSQHYQPTLINPFLLCSS
jgi:hypothetical protein